MDGSAPHDPGDTTPNRSAPDTPSMSIWTVAVIFTIAAGAALLATFHPTLGVSIEIGITVVSLLISLGHPARRP